MTEKQEEIHDLKPGPEGADGAAPLTLQRLLAPVAGDDPCGVDLRYDGTYDAVQEAREEDADLPQGVWERKLKKADWEAVERICREALEQRSKDMQLAVWWLEAAVYLHGFEGCLMGLRLVTGLIEAFWDGLYPLPDDGDMETRVGPLVWLNEKAAFKLKLVPITAPRTTDERTYTYADWEHALHLEKLAVKDKSLIDRAESEGQATRARFLGSVMFTPAAFYAQQARRIDESLSELARINRLVDERCGPQAPSLNAFRQTLEEIQARVKGFLKEKQGDAEPEAVPDSEPVGDAGAVEATGSPARSSLSIHSREEAYTLLTAAADYLSVHEPHSPTPHLVRRAVSWGRMSLTELLQELIDDDGNLRQIYQLLGLRVPPRPPAGG